MIVREEQNANDEIRRQWEEHDRNRRTKTLAQNWPNRANYEAQLQRIANINKNQGKIFLFFAIKIFCSLIGFAKNRRSEPVSFQKAALSDLPELEKMKLN